MFYTSFSLYKKNNSGNTKHCLQKLMSDENTEVFTMKFINCIALTVVIIGAINWGLIGFFDWNLVDAIFGAGSLLSRIIYGLVGICGIYSLMFYPRVCSNEA